MTRTRALLLLPFLLLGCAAPAQDEAGTNAGRSESGPKADASATFACRHFRNVIGDADVLNDAELREKIKEVEEDANVSKTPGIAEHGRGMLAAITADDAEAFTNEAAAFAEACSTHGV